MKVFGGVDGLTPLRQGALSAPIAAMEQQAPRKLSFKLAAVSGEEPEYPATELLAHHTHNRGWQSARFAADD